MKIRQYGKKQNLLKDNRGVICACIITAVLLLLVYGVRGIYPFGLDNISYYDMSQANVPAAYYTYDVLHGEVGMWWNWQMGGGATLADSIGNTIFSPFNILFLFVERSKILECMSWFLLIKLCACAASMAYYSQKTFAKLNPFWHTVLGILYASCGFALQYYTNIHFLDIVALFPVLIYFCDKMLQEEKVVGYVLLLAAGLINNVQMMSMVCWFIVLYVAYHLRVMEKGKRKRVGFLLGLSTLIAICISACIVFPVLAVLFSSGRAELEVNSTYEYIMGILINYDKNAKLFMFYGSEVCLAVVAELLICKKKQLKETWQYLRMVILLALPIPFELVNRFWHIGGYVQFPMRFGYMLAFAGLALLGKILLMDAETGVAEAEKENAKVKCLRKYAGLFAIAGIPFLGISLYGFVELFSTYGIRDIDSFQPYWSVLVITAVIYFLALSAEEKRIRCIVCGLLAVIQFTVGWYGFLAPEKERAPECTDSIVTYSELLRDSLRKEDDRSYNSIYRIKDASVSLNSNYGNIVGRATMASWSYGINSNMVPLLANWGYNNIYIRTVDSGGTIFSDAFLHMSAVVSYQRPNEALYTLESQVGEYYIGESKYLYPFGTVVSEFELSEELTGEKNTVFDWQNALYQMISGDNSELISTLYVEEYLISEGIDEETGCYSYEYSVPVTELSALYLMAKTDNRYMFWIGGEQVKIPDIENKDNYAYPAYFVNGLIEIGVYEDDTINLRVLSQLPLEEKAISLGQLSLEKLEKSIAYQKQYERNLTIHKNGLTMQLNGAKEGSYLLLPLADAKDFVVTVNGQKQENIKALEDALVMIELDAGENDIELKYVPKGFKLGIAISLLGVVLLLVVIRFKEKVLSCAWLNGGVLGLYYLVNLGFLLLVYVIPMIVTIIVRIKYRGI